MGFFVGNGMEKRKRGRPPKPKELKKEHGRPKGLNKNACLDKMAIMHEWLSLRDSPVPSMQKHKIIAAKLGFKTEKVRKGISHHNRLRTSQNFNVFITSGGDLYVCSDSDVPK